MRDIASTTCYRPDRSIGNFTSLKKSYLILYIILPILHKDLSLHSLLSSVEIEAKLSNHRQRCIFVEWIDGHEKLRKIF